jgi:hypothetical protein
VLAAQQLNEDGAGRPARLPETRVRGSRPFRLRCIRARRAVSPRPHQGNRRCVRPAHGGSTCFSQGENGNGVQLAADTSSLSDASNDVRLDSIIVEATRLEGLQEPWLSPVDLFAGFFAGAVVAGMIRGTTTGAATRAEAALAERAFWGRAESLASHFARHGADVGASTAEGYAQSASRLFVRSQLEGLPTKIDATGIIRVYDPVNNIFGAFNPTGTARTLFSPVRGAAYFAEQPGVSPWLP